jgi:DNA-directed RNA polymerase subunit RPC12/RpoP
VVKVNTFENGMPVGKVECVQFGGTNNSVPTLVCHAQEYGDEYFGHQAEANSAQGELFSNFKLDLVSDDPVVRERALKLTRQFFGYLYRQYDDQRTHFPTCEKETTYVSYPVKWPSELAEEMLKIATDAGFLNVVGIDEASAAIHAVSILQEETLQRLGEGTFNVLLIDMGAGTTDLAFCRYTAGRKTVEIVNTWPKAGGDALFGGREIDTVLWEYVKEYLKKCGVSELRNEYLYLPPCKTWKEQVVSPKLNEDNPVTHCTVGMSILSVMGEAKPFDVIDRTVFGDILGGYLRQFPELVNGILNNTPGFSHADVDLVVLAGGHSQWYFANEILSGKLTAFGEVDLPKIKADPWRIVKLSLPHETVALGMVYQPMAMVVKKAKPQSKQFQAVCMDCGDSLFIPHQLKPGQKIRCKNCKELKATTKTQKTQDAKEMTLSELGDLVPFKECTYVVDGTILRAVAPNGNYAVVTDDVRVNEAFRREEAFFYEEFVYYIAEGVNSPPYINRINLKSQKTERLSDGGQHALVVHKNKLYYIDQYKKLVRANMSNHEKTVLYKAGNNDSVGRKLASWFAPVPVAEESLIELTGYDKHGYLFKGLMHTASVDGPFSYSAVGLKADNHYRYRFDTGEIEIL